MIDGTDTGGAPGEKPDFRRKRRSSKPAGNVTHGDRLPPHALEAEQAVLGCALLAPQECLGECVETLKAGPMAFYDIRHQVLYELLVEMYDKKEHVDLITVQQRLKDQGQLESVGGRGYISELPDKVASAAMIGTYLSVVWDKYILRRTIQVCSSVVAKAFEHTDSVDSLIDEVEKDILQISQERVNTTSPGMRELVNKAVEKIQFYYTHAGQTTGISTGFLDLDRMTNGLQPGDMVVIAARPSMGKTSFAMNIVEHVAVEQKIPVGVFSLEMTSESLVMRMLSSCSRVNMRNIQDGFLAETDFAKLTSWAGRLAAAPLYIDDTSGLSILQMRAKARRMWQQHHVRLIVIDYLQLLHSTSRRAENRQQEIADISNGIKALAKELRVPVIVLGQLNREFEKDKSRKPKLSDLRESGAIEQDADLVGLLYKADPENPGRAQSRDDDGEAGVEQDVIPVNLLIAKQRNGPTGDVRMTFLKKFTRFENAAKISEEDRPQGG
jgi:replicative DNA helicase